MFGGWVRAKRSESAGAELGDQLHDPGAALDEVREAEDDDENGVVGGGGTCGGDNRERRLAFNLREERGKERKK